MFHLFQLDIALTTASITWYTLLQLRFQTSSTYFVETVQSKSNITHQQNQMRRITLLDRKQQNRRASTVAKTQLPIPHDQSLKFYMGAGNNANLIRQVLSNRIGWNEVDNKQSFVNLRWQQTNKGYRYQTCIDNRIFRHSLNHFEYHHELSNKEYLFNNLYQYCQTHKINVFGFVPLTFVLNLVESNFEQEQTFFVNFFNHNKPQHDKPIEEVHLRRRRVNPNNLLNLSPKLSGFHCKYEIQRPFTSQNSPYLWILKPTFYNRGNGVHVISNLSQMQNLMNKYIQGVSPGGSLKPTKYLPQVVKKKSFRIREVRDTSMFVIRSNSFVIQKYLQKPLLFQGRKFDIRMWILFTHQLKVYCFKRGYLRTSSYQYNLTHEKVADLNVHLTNNAVQKFNQDYGRYEQGNQLSFDALRQLVESRGRSYEQLISKIKEIIKLTALSVRRKINKQERSYCFEVFGYDFMLDEDCSPWLIEVNTNPCIEQSSAVLQQLLPRMLDDAFALTIDQIFDIHRRTQSRYPVSKEADGQNLWQLVVDLKRYS